MSPILAIFIADIIIWISGLGLGYLFGKSNRKNKK